MKTDWEFDHIGLVVKDLDEITTYYASIGIGVDVGTLGPNATNPVPGSSEEEPIPRTQTVYGKPSPARQRRPPSASDPVVLIARSLEPGDRDGGRSRPTSSG